MDSKYIHLIALIVAVFFAGVYLRGEAARKKEIKRQISAIQHRQDEINGIIDEIERVTAEKDSLLKLKIARAKREIRTLDREGELVRDSVDVLGNKITATQIRIAALWREIDNVPDFVIDAPPSIHSLAVDPDLEPADSVAFNPIRTFLAPQLERSVAEQGNTFLPPHAGIAKMFAERGVQEVPPGSNRGPDVEKFLAAVGLEPSKDRFGKWTSYPYCAAFVSFCLDEAGDIDLPRVRSARAQDFITRNSIPANKVLRGSEGIPAGTIVVWKRNARDPDDPRGHVGIVLDWRGQAGTTVEGNTSPPGGTGSQREGEGVYVRKRMLQPGNAFRITHFTRVRYDQP